MEKYKQLDAMADKVRTARVAYEVEVAALRAAREKYDAARKCLREVTKKWEDELAELSPPVYTNLDTEV